jgi:hypothetical protein
MMTRSVRPRNTRLLALVVRRTMPSVRSDASTEARKRVHGLFIATRLAHERHRALLQLCR